MAIGNILVRVGANISDYEDKMRRVGKIMDMSMTETTYAMQRTGNTIAKIGTVIATSTAGAIGGATALAAKYEQSFAEVKKVLEGTPEQFEALSGSIRNMAKELPMSVYELTELAAAAGRLGVPIEQVERFTRVTADLGVTTNMAAADAAEAFARFANIMDMPLDQVDRLGSTVVELGNNLATSEREIVNMGLRMAGVGRTIGLTEAEVMSLAGAISATGIRAEAGGSAFTRTMNIINTAVGEGSEAVEGFAKVANMSSEDFIKAWGDSPAEALADFVEGLRKISDEGGNTASVLNDLDIKGVYNHDLMNRMAGASEMVRESLEMGNRAWKENTALQDEANVRYETFISKLEVLKNRFVDMGIVIGDVFKDVFSQIIDKMDPVLVFLEDLVQKFAESSDGFKQFVAIAALLTPVAGVFMVIAGLVITFTAKLVEAYRVFKTIGPLVRIAGSVVKGLGVAFSIVGLKVLAVVAIIAGAVYLIIKYWEPIKEFFVGLWDYVSEVSIAVWEGIKAAWQASVEFLKGVWQGVSEFFVNLWNSITETASNIWEAVVNAWMTHVNFMMDMFGPLFDYFSNLWTTIVDNAKMIWETLVSTLSTIWDNIKTIAGSAWEIIKNVILGPILLLIDLARGDFENFNKDLIAIWNNIKDAGERIWESIKEIFVTIVQAIVDVSIKLWESLKETTSNLLSALGETISNTWGKAKEVTTRLLAQLVIAAVNKFNELKEAAIKRIVDLVADLVKKWNELKSKTLELITGVKDNVIKPLKEIDLLQIGKDAIEGFIKGITSKIADVGRAAKKAADAVTDKIRSVLRIKSPSRVLMGFGRDTMDGYIIGVEERKAAAVQVVDGLFKDILKVVKDSTRQEQADIKKNNAEIKKIEKRAAEDISIIRSNAAKKKRKLTKQESIRIQRIQEDSAKKLRDLQEKNNKINLDIAKKQSDLMVDIANKYIAEQRRAGKLTLSGEIYFWNSIRISAEKGSKLYEEAIKNHQSAVKTLRSETERIMKDFNDRALAIEKNYMDESQKLYDEMGKMQESRTNDLMGFANLFSVFEREMEVTGNDLVASLESQVIALMDYSSAINSLERRIDDEGLMNELRAMGVGAVGELEALNRMSDTQLEKYVTLYKQKFNLASGQAETELRPMTDSINRQLENLRKQADYELKELADEVAKNINTAVKGAKKEFDTMYDVGVDAMNGLIKGLSSMNGSLYDSVAAIAETVLGGLKSAFDINSPSKKTFVMGGEIGQGLANGIMDAVRIVTAATTHLTEAAMPSVGEVDLSYSTPKGRHGTLRSALNGTVDVNDGGDNRIVEAIERLEDKMTDLTVQMDGQAVARVTNGYQNDINVRRTAFKSRSRGRTI